VNVVCFVCNSMINYAFCVMFVQLLHYIYMCELKSYSKQLNNKTYQHCYNLKYVFLYTYKQNDEQTLKHTEVTLGEHDTKSTHL